MEQPLPRPLGVFIKGKENKAQSMSWFSKLPHKGDPVILLTFHWLEQVTWVPMASKGREM